MSDDYSTFLARKVVAAPDLGVDIDDRDLHQDLITWRAMRMYSNTGDVVLSPFAGIGSEGYVALKNGRKFVGCELKREYFEQAASHLDAVERQGTLI